MEQWIGGLAVVTGASSGIGAAVTSKLVKSGVIVVGLARRIEALEELEASLTHEKGTFHPKQCDISNDDEIFAVFEWIEESLGPVSIIINAAGVLKPATLIEGSTDVWKETFDVNILGLCVCTREALKSMKAHEIAGHIVHVNCLVGHVLPELPLPEPLLNVYPATKHAVRALTETLRKELRGSNSKIKVSSVSPSYTISDMYNEFPENAAEALSETPRLTADDVANAIIYVLATPPGVQIQDLIIRAIGDAL
ncbi:farnesol dehydrogenase-like [Photinus pyralis]|uniref:farnesol dehydrogenase-like n=1 Tax=Photinus pyralis TaxID=7054 RepID=UPI001266F5C9|nr:farnesol dehydrogenase-like [Photinus pyralis]